MKEEIKRTIDEKIKALFNKPADPDDYDPAFTKPQNKLRYVLHTATIMHGQMLEVAYLNALKKELTDCNVWEDKSFKVSRDALSVSTEQSDRRVLETFLPYGECVKIGNREKKTQVDAIVYNNNTKKVTAFEIKRGGSHHDRQKKEKLLADIIATQVLLKDYTVQKGYEVKDAKTLLISHMGTQLLQPDWTHLQINGNKVNEYFGNDIIQHVTAAENYWIKKFNEEYKKLISQ